MRLAAVLVALLLAGCHRTQPDQERPSKPPVAVSIHVALGAPVAAHGSTSWPTCRVALSASCPAGLACGQAQVAPVRHLTAGEHRTSMVKKIVALLVLAPVLALSASCISAEDSAEDKIGEAEEAAKGSTASILPGPCATACADVASGACDWQGDCDGTSVPLVFCGQKFLSCDEAQHAANGEAWGLVYCYRGCENLR